MHNRTFEEVIERCRTSYYDEVADVLEYFEDHSTNQFGDVYSLKDSPGWNRDDLHYERNKKLLWAFKAGRAYERDKNE